MAREAVIVGSVRTGLTKAHRGSFNMTEPVAYTAHALREVVAQQSKLDPAEIEDVIIGCGNPKVAWALTWRAWRRWFQAFPRRPLRRRSIASVRPGRRL